MFVEKRTEEPTTTVFFIIINNLNTCIGIILTHKQKKEQQWDITESLSLIQRLSRNGRM